MAPRKSSRPKYTPPVSAAVIYARYSSASQREESIEDQLRECRRWAELHDLQIVGEYCDYAISGRSDDRPQFQRMIADAEKGLFSAVILYKTDRFARNRVDSAVYKQRLKQCGVSVYYAKEAIPDGPEGIILESVMEGLAEYYSANLSQNIRRGLEGNALKAKALGGTRPLGLRITSDQTYEPDPLTAPHVLRAFEIIDDGGSIKDAVTYLNGVGMRTTRGQVFTYTTMQTVLTNRKYIGEYRYKDIILPDAIPPIVPLDMFDRVQLRLAAGRRTKGGHGRAMDEYLLTSKIFCGHCGSPMVGESGTSRNGVTHHYYACSCRKKQHACTKAAERKVPLETYVVQQAVQHVLQPDVIKTIAARAIELYEQDLRDDPVLATLEGELKNVNISLANLMRAIEAGIFTPTTRDRMLELESQKTDLSSRIVRQRNARPRLTVEHIEFFLSSLAGGDPSDEDYRRQIIDALIGSVVVTDLPPTPTEDAPREFRIRCNLSRNAEVRVRCSDVVGYAPLYPTQPNTICSICADHVLLVTKTEAPT